ncbi:phosphoribosylglycinamide formyltransferase [Sandaracinobacteroides saxicola]|uniref:Phosphoribosylglycinamide formyltransferase n=1 Tax=Sandaracinobacteroides saxicola TaxID=2759707 RepID=A0A7G5IHS1_9SPHN|nr:phosphoribosylglycinamide formyltransferase [Sandaracinobacteroides saxicola]QMW22913.1 phosphoribosylglycinamide formyltransferase [Sandaracinobacteroides saxicola]
MTDRVRLAAIISGRGSNMAALLAASRAADCPYALVLVVSDLAEAAGLATARDAGVPALLVPRRKDRAAFEVELDAALRAAHVELVALAGFMRILTPWFIARWQGRLLNIHPSLLPAYKGLDTHARAIAAGDREAGCSVHHVTAELDGGAVIAQARVPILPGDTPETLAARVLGAEHDLYPAAVAAVARGLEREGGEAMLQS